LATPRAPLSATLSSVAAGVLGLLQTRLELAGHELEDGITSILLMVLMGGLLLVFTILGLLVGSLTLVFLFDGTARVIAMALLALVYLLLAAGLGFKLRADVTNRTPLFAATLAEFARDRAALMKHAAIEEELHE
jgi:uncharacterized membrane protein YqjE